MKILIFVFLISNCFALHAQDKENTFEKIIVEIDGEEIYDVREITQDGKGYLWMATNLGLIRFDGLEAKKYVIKSKDSSLVVNDFIGSLFTDHQGDIWIGSRNGLSKYSSDCDCFRRYSSDNEGVNLISVTSIAEDQDNNIWIGTWNGELFRYDRRNASFSRFLNSSTDSLPLISGAIEHILVDQGNNLWIGTNSHDSIKASGLLRFNNSSGKLKQFSHDPADQNSLIDNRISALYEDQQGQLLIGTYKSGFHIYDVKNETLDRISFDHNNPGQLHAPYTEENVFGGPPYVHLIHQDQKGNYWIGTTGKGINHFDTTSRTFENHNFKLVNPQLLWSIYEDRQGNIWTGGISGSGLFKTDLFARKYNLNTNFINVEAAYETFYNPGIIWVKSRQQGLGKLSVSTNQITRYKHDENNSKSIGHNWVRSAFQENNNVLWLGLGTGGAEGTGGGDGGVDRMDIETETFEHFKLTRKDDGKDDFSYSPLSICEDPEGYLWVSAGTGGIFRSNKEKNEFKPFKLGNNDDTPRDVILNVVRKDSLGDIWASDFKDGGTLYLYDRIEKTFKPYLEGFKMVNILIDKYGWYVISTWDNGLVHLNPGDSSYIRYTKEDGLPSNNALDITEGEDGIIWVGTRMGPAKFNVELGEVSTLGLPKGRYNTGVFRASDGQIYMGANKGLVSFYPHEVMGNPFPPQIDINELLNADTNLLKGRSKANELVLSHNQNDISFKYKALHYSDSEKNLHQYRLKPLDDKWINAGNESTARYFNLPPGSYTFEVKAANSDGVWTDTPQSVDFIIKPSWWTRWWAYILYVVVLALTIYRIYLFQVSKKIADSESKRLKEVNQFKNTLFTNISHEFRTPLTVIKGMADSIKSNIENKQLDDLETPLEMIDRNSDGLLLLVNEMLDLAKIESGNMELQLVQADVIPFLKYTSESFSSLSEENQISLTVYSETETLLMDFDANKLTSIVSNLLSNAIKFTPELGKIIVHIKQITQKDNSYLYIKVKDSGIGISSDELPNIFNRFYQADASAIRKEGGTGIGLALTKELVDLMNGSIDAKSTLNIGSEFSVRIPVTRKAPISGIENGKVPRTIVTKVFSTQSNQYLESDSELPLVLIIEDNVDVIYYLETCLKNKYETIHAANGTLGIDLALEKIPDIIISDVMMPGKDGFEVCATLKSDERTDHIPIIILTAKVTFEDRLKGLSYGADAYLAKPFVKEELFTRLDQLVSVRKKLIAKIQNEGFTTLSKKRTENPKLQFLQKVEKLIHEDLDDSNFGSVDLARKLLISDSQLYRKLKAITGKSTAVFIRSIRLQHAKELLIASGKTVSEVAYEVGFNDPSWFSRAFKDEFGFAPSTRSK